MSERDFYRDLGVGENASPRKIEKAHRRLARQYHPGRNPGSTEAEDRMRVITEAYGVLSSPVDRELYDLVEARGRYSRMTLEASESRSGLSEEAFLTFFAEHFGEDLEEVRRQHQARKEARREAMVEDSRRFNRNKAIASGGVLGFVGSAPVLIAESQTLGMALAKGAILVTATVAGAVAGHKWQRKNWNKFGGR